MHALRVRIRRGLTLVQVAVAMAIVAVLVLVAVPLYRGSRIKAYISEARHVAREWTVAAASYWARSGSWQGATDQQIGWVSPNSRVWTYGPHEYGPQGFEDEAWFVANLRPGLGANLHDGTAWAGVVIGPGDGDPDYMLIFNGATRLLTECGRLLNKPCGGRSPSGGGGGGGGGGSGQPPTPPQNLRLLSASSNSLSVAWDDSQGESWYLLQYRPSGYQTWDYAETWLFQDTTSYTISWLTPETQYEIRVIAYNDYGQAPSNVLVASTTGAPPAAPTNLVVQSFTTAGSTATIAWQDNAGNESGYRIERRPFGTSSWSTEAVLPANSTTGQVQSIPAGQAVEVRVVAYNQHGDSPSSQTAYVFHDEFQSPPTWVNTNSFGWSNSGYVYSTALSGTATAYVPSWIVDGFVQARITLTRNDSGLPVKAAIFARRGISHISAELQMYTGSDPSNAGVWLSVFDGIYTYVQRLSDPPASGASVSYTLAIRYTGWNPVTYRVFVDGQQVMQRTTTYPSGQVPNGYPGFVYLRQSSTGHIAAFSDFVAYGRVSP